MCWMCCGSASADGAAARRTPGGSERNVAERPHERSLHSDRSRFVAFCGLFLLMPWRSVVCVLDAQVSLCKKGWTSIQPVWTVDSRRPKDPCIRWRFTLAPLGEYDESIFAASAMRLLAIITVATCPVFLLILYAITPRIVQWVSWDTS